MTTPVISIITSTYNGSHVLKYAISSVIDSNFTDWELIIVGDHCTDDTEAVVDSFKDRRIRFTNLDRNSGQQATPSNVGLSQARGRFIAYLNQDDMYFPWHLTAMLETVAATGADIVCAGHAIIEGAAESGAGLAFLASPGPVARRNVYSPVRWYLASTWFMTAAAAREVGPWRLEQELYVAPSQEWMFRAWKMGKRIVCPDEVSLLLILSGKRSGSYRERSAALHAAVYQDIIRSPDPRAALAQAQANGARRPPRRMHDAARGAYDILVGKPSMLLGIHPDALHRILRFGIRRGGGVKHWQRIVHAKR